MARNSGRFYFDGGPVSYLGTGIIAALITVCTFGTCFPFAIVLLERWRAKHTYIDGQRPVFSGTGMGLFGLDQTVPAVHDDRGHLLLLGLAAHPAVEGREHRLRPTWRPNTLA